MNERVNFYDICHNPQKAWDALSDQIKHAQNDLYIMAANSATLGEMPKDVKQTLRGLQVAIQNLLAE